MFNIPTKSKSKGKAALGKKHGRPINAIFQQESDDDQVQVEATGPMVVGKRTAVMEAMVNNLIETADVSNDQPAEAEVEDDNDYDAHYDNIKAAEARARLKRQGVTNGRQPRYVNSMMKAAFKRGQQLEVYNDRKLERELEGEDPVDRFVTDAYLEHKEELQRLEKEEEALAADPTKASDKNYVEFYKNMMELRTGGVLPPSNAQENDDDIAIEASPSPADIKLEKDEDGENKLDAGLNIIITKPRVETLPVAIPPLQVGQAKQNEHKRKRDKISQEFQKQMEELELEKQREIEAANEKAKSLLLQHKSTSDAVEQARRRAEGRKRARLLEQKSEHDQ